MTTNKNATFRSGQRVRWVSLAVLALQWYGSAQAAEAAAAAEADQATTAATTAAPTTTNEKEKSDKEATTLQRVTITATRRPEPLQTSSTSASVLTGDDLTKLGVNIVDQIQFAMPSATANNFGQGLNFNIRGIGKAETNTQTTVGVISYRDGIATFPGYFAEEPYYDIASVQIFRGPQGTFGGQNAIGGAVFVESNDPSIKGGVSGYLAGQFGNYSDKAVQGAVNLPINSTMAARVAFNTEDRNSFWNITGPYTGGNGALHSRSARMGFIWQPTSALTVLLKADLNRIDMGAYPSDPVNSPNDPFNITANGDQKAKDRFGRTTLKVEYTFDNGTKFRSITGRQTGNTAYNADLDGTSVGRNEFRDSVDEFITSQEFNLISPDSGAFTWIAGAYTQKDTYTFPVGQFVIGVPLGSIYSEYRLGGTNPKKTWAAFGQIGYLLTDELKLVVEGRYSKSSTANNVNVMQYGTPILAQQEAKFNNFSGKVALNWTLNENHFLYAFAASAFRPGGLNVPVGLGLPAPFDEEKVKTFEAGWKATWMGGQVQTQTSAFYNNYRNFQVTIGYPNYPTFGFELNTPNPTKMYGLEGQIQAKLGEGWAARANLGWLHSSIGEFFATDPRAASVAPCDIAKGPAGPTCLNLGGHEQTYAPSMTFNASLERRFMIGDTSITPRINYAYISSQWATLFQNRARGDEIGARNLLGAQIDWERGDWMGSLYGTNLTDKRYLAAIGSGLRYAGAPRQYGVRVTKFF